MMDQAALAISAEVLDETQSLRTTLTQMSRDWTDARGAVGMLRDAAEALCRKLDEGPKDAPWSAELAAMQKALSIVPDSTLPFNADKPSWNDMAYIKADLSEAQRRVESMPSEDLERARAHIRKLALRVLRGDSA